MTDPIFILDGGFGTRLEDRGNDITGSLWSAQILRDNPAEVLAAHRDFFDAGADIATTCSYEVTVDGLIAAGAPVQDADALAESLLRSSVRLARDAAREASAVDGRDRGIAASVGPYGAGPGEGTEYDGAYGVSSGELARWHRRRIGVLADTGANWLLAETVPSILEVEALAGELSAAGHPALLSVTVKDGTLSDGTDLKEVASIVADTPVIQGLGVNCGAVPDVLAGVRRMAEFTDTPLIAYPNSGETWDHVGRVWVPRSGEPASLIDAVPDLLDAGVRYIGGCCRVTPREITAVRDRVAQARPQLLS